MQKQTVQYNELLCLCHPASTITLGGLRRELAWFELSLKQGTGCYGAHRWWWRTMEGGGAGGTRGWEVSLGSGAGQCGEKG